MDKLYITLTMDLTPRAPKGPGWYLYTIFDDKPVGEPVFLSETQVEQITGGIDVVVGGLGSDNYHNIAKSGNKLVYNALEQQLKEAEEQATRISSLRKRLSEFSNESNDQEQ